MTMTNAATSLSPQRTGISVRKTNKPLMEKRRRARINDSLSQLKSLVIQSSKKDSSQFNKLEKADILELTVKHLRNLQDQHQQRLTHVTSDTSLAGKYQAGFMECANEVIRYLGQSQSFGDDIKARVVHHLANCIQLSNKISIAKCTQSGTSAAVTNSSVMSAALPTNNSAIPAGLRATNGQFVNGQIIQVLNTQFQKITSPNAGSFTGTQPLSIGSVIPASSTPTHISVAVSSTSTSTTPSSEPPSYMKYTQPLQIQIPPVLSPALIQSKTVQHQKSSLSQVVHKPNDVKPQILPYSANPKQETPFFLNSPPLQSRERTPPSQPFTTCQKPQKYYTYDDQYSDFIPRSRTYSLTSSSSSSESELSSPLNLSQSPKYYDHREINNKYHHQRAVVSHHTQPHSHSYNEPVTRDGLLLSQCRSSNFTSVIVDGRKTLDGHSLHYMHLMDEDRHFVRHEGPTSPASSVGEERLWRPW